jgi:hypothetical protein
VFGGANAADGADTAGAASVGVAADGGRDDGICHAQGSGRIRPDLRGKVLESWDRAVAVSRASLQRQMAVILRGLA